jgi:hypothetical protein
MPYHKCYASTRLIRTLEQSQYWRNSQVKNRKRLTHRDSEKVEWENEHRSDHDEHDPPEKES